MSRPPYLTSPLMIGFEELEQMLDRAMKISGDGYPPYNIEKVNNPDAELMILRITVAVAGFEESELEVLAEQNQLVITGKKQKAENTEYLHRGIATRQFKKAFMLADGLEITTAQLKNGLLSIDLIKPENQTVAKVIKINEVK